MLIVKRNRLAWHEFLLEFIFADRQVLQILWIFELGINFCSFQYIAFISKTPFSAFFNTTLRGNHFLTITSCPVQLIIGSLRNQEATLRTKSIKKMTLNFIYESRDTHKSSSLSLRIETITKLNLGLSRTTQNMVISRCYFARDGKNMYKGL